MLFKYISDAQDNFRCFRPDLHHIIQQWLAVCPAEAWHYLVGFRVGTCGTFIAKFMKAPETGGELRLICIEVGASGTVMWTDTHTWADPYPASLSMTALTRAANTI